MAKQTVNQEVVNPASILEAWENQQQALREKCAKAFKDAGLEYEIKMPPNDKLLDLFRKWTKKSRKPIDRAVGQIMRVETGQGSFLVYDVIYTGSDHIGNFATAFERVGVQDIPKVMHRKEMTEEGDIVVKDAVVQSVKPEYFIKWSAEIVDALKPFLAEKLSCVFRPLGTTVKYGGFRFDELRNLDADELETTGKYGSAKERAFKKQAQ